MSRILCGARPIDNDLTQGGAMDSTQPQASILAVDDDTRSLMALRGLVSEMSLSLVTAKSGDEALRCVQAGLCRHPDGRSHAGSGRVRSCAADPRTRTLTPYPDHLPHQRLRRRAFSDPRV